MSKVEKGDVVKFEYTAELTDGTLLDASKEGEPLEVTVGEGRVIPGVDSALLGMEAGESKTVELSPDYGYGPHREELILRVPQEMIPKNMDPQVGQQLRVRSEDGRDAYARVTEIDESHVTLDANHPLAGKTLTMHIHLVEIA